MNATHKERARDLSSLLCVYGSIDPCPNIPHVEYKRRRKWMGKIEKKKNKNGGPLLLL